MTNINYETIGAVETEPSAPLVGLFNPTEFDKAAEAIRKRLKAEFNWDFINAELWGLIGVTGGPIKKWLTLYIKESNRLRKPYYQSDLAQWQAIFSNYGYDIQTTNTYLRVFRQLHDEGAISATIYSPFNYNASEEPEVGQVVWFETQKMLYSSIGMLVAGSVGYLLLKEYIFAKKSKKGS